MKIKRYGNIWNAKKIKNTILEKYGVDNIQKLSMIHKNRKSKYFYKGKYFDSKPELATFIFHEDNGYDITYHPDKYFDYYFDNVLHRYFPDFKINGKYYEVKGDHFFSGDKMICPFKDNKWDTKRYKYECDKYNTKYECMKINGVRLIRSNIYSSYIDFINNKYGTKYLNNFRIIKQ